MRRQTRSTAKSVAAGCAALLCVCAFAAWKYFQPKIQTASKAEIRAALPPDMLYGDKTDVQALVRMTRLVAIARRFTSTDYGRITGPMAALKERGTIARDLWSEDKDSIDLIKTLLKEGPLQYTSSSDVMGNNGELDAIKGLARSLSFIAMATASIGDFATAADAIEMDLQLSSRMQHAGGGFLPYVVSVAVIGATENAIEQVARTQGCPTGLCRKWLNRLPSDADSDKMLASAIREDFQSRVLPLLSEPALVMRDLIRNGYYAGGFFRSDPAPEEYEGVGSFDPLATAKAVAQVVELQIANAGRPLDKYSDLPDNLVIQETKGLPDVIGRRRSFERIRFRLTMNTEPNSIGRSLVLLDTRFGSKGSVDLSCHWRTMDSCTKALLALTLYRADHDRRLPESLSQLVPAYLPSLPIDFYTGKPLFYDPARQIVWSVGPDLKNDGGQIFSPQRFMKDVGLYLGPADEKSDMSGSYDNQVRGTTFEIRRIDSALR